MNIKNRIATLFAVAAIVIGSGFSEVQAQKLGHVNLNELIRTMPDFKTAQENLQKFQASLEMKL